MAKKIAKLHATAPTPPDLHVGQKASRPTKVRVKLPLVIVAALLVGAVLGYFWNQHQRWEQLLRSLPATPSMSRKPRALAERFAAANAGVSAHAGVMTTVIELARLYHANGYAREAEICWSLLAADQPEEAHWSYYLADLKRSAVDAAGPKALLERTAKLAPNYAPAWRKLGELEFKTGKLNEAERAYNRVLGLIPADPYARLGLARLKLQRGFRSEARHLIEAIVREVPDFPSSHNVYAEILAQDGEVKEAAFQGWLGTMAGRYREADDPWIEELRAWCYDPTQLLVWGVTEVQTNRKDRARALFEHVIQLVPEDPRGYENLGRLHLDSGNPGKARELLEKGSVLPDASEMLFTSLCETYITLKQPTEAVRVARQGLAAIPGSADLMNSWGLALEAAGRPEEAIEAYRTASARQPSAANPVTNIGLSLLRLGRRDEAYASFKRALELQPMFPKALAILGRLELEAGHLDSATQYIRPYFEQYPGSKTGSELMGRWYLFTALKAIEAGNEAEAERICREGIAAKIESSELYGFLSMLCTQHGQTAEALDLLEKAHHFQPVDPRISLALASAHVQAGRIGDARTLLKQDAAEARQRGDNQVAEKYEEIIRKLPE